MKQRIDSAWATLVVVMLLAGCASPLEKSWSVLPGVKSAAEEKRMRDPQRLVTVWSEAAYTVAGTQPIRGFGGRIYFFNEAHKPVEVTGQLTVYAFDDTYQATHKTQPDRRFVFTPEQFKSHFSQSDLGPSYSVWLPWETLNDSMKKISLLPVFTTSDGKRIVGQQAMNVLPGKSAETMVDQSLQYRHLQAKGKGPLQQVSHQQQAVRAGLPTLDETRHSLNTTTIALPKSMSRRLQQSPATLWDSPSRPPTAETLREAGRHLPSAYREVLEPTAAPTAPGVTPDQLEAQVPAWVSQLAPAGQPKRSSRFERSRFPAQAGPDARSTRDRVDFPRYPRSHTSLPPSAP